MIQRDVKINGKLAACPTPTCGKQPRHIQHGLHLHSLECPPCQTSTGRFNTFQEAIERWEAQDTTQFQKVA